jgi:hypothetical protein
MVAKETGKAGSETKYDELGKRILAANDSILSLTINDDKGEVLGKAFTREYDSRFLDSAKDMRSRAGLFSALIFGIASEPEKIFGETRAIVRLYADVKLILLPFSDRKMMATLLTKNSANTDRVIEEITPLLRTP